MDDRFLRIERLLGAAAMARLANSMVTVAGCGAVGGYAIEGLARAGVGRIRIIDFDVIRRHNINRQIIALEHTVGWKKVTVMAERVAAINPACRIEPLDLFVDRTSIPAILEPRPDLVIDAIDSLGPKIELLAAAHSLGIAVISSMGAALRTDPTLIRCGDLFDTKDCPLARRIRKKLRRRGIERGIPCVYSTEKIAFDYDEPDADEDEKDETKKDESPGQEDAAAFTRGRERRVLGSLPTLTGIFGLTVANLAIRRLAGLDGG